LTSDSFPQDFRAENALSCGVFKIDHGESSCWLPNAHEEASSPYKEQFRFSFPKDSTECTRAPQEEFVAKPPVEPEA
jgi:hypothetical protein